MSNENINVSAAAKLVSVGCKLPNGLHLDLKNRQGDPVRYTLKGANASRIVGGYGITENVPAEFMTEWLKRNAKHPAVLNGAIFIHDDKLSTESIAKERREVRTGLEPIDPRKTGMMRTADGTEDAAAVRAYEDQKLKNPERNRQLQE